MDLSYTPEQEAFRSEVRAFLAKNAAKVPAYFGVNRPTPEAIAWQKLLIGKGYAARTIPVEYGGNEMVVGFNPSFLIDFLKNVDQEEIDMELLGSDKPAVMRMGDYLYLALPMRI